MTDVTVGERLKQSMASMTASERKVARALLAAYPIAGLETIAQLADRAGVSAPTVMRFISRIGFSRYPAFQQALRDELEKRLSSPLTMYDSSAGADTSAVLERSRAIFREELDGTFRSLIPAEFEAIADSLLDKSRAVYCIGGRFSQILAYYLFAHLRMLRPHAFLLERGLDPVVDQLVDMRKRDLCIVFDYRRYQKDTFEVARTAADKGATVVLFTDPWLSPVASVATHVLPASVRAPSPFDALVCGLAVVETLIGALAERAGEPARERLAALEDLRSRVEASDEPDSSASFDGQGRDLPVVRRTQPSSPGVRNLGTPNVSQKGTRREELPSKKGGRKRGSL